MSQMDLYEQSSGSKNRAGDDFVSDYIPLVRRIACHIRKKLPENIDLEDMIQSGIVGLLEARHTFRNDKGATFETFAGIRVRGAIIDALRKNSWYTRQSSSLLRQISGVKQSIEQKLGRPPRDQEVATELSVSMEEYLNIQRKILFVRSVSDCEDETPTTDNYFVTDRAAELELMTGSLKQALKQLTERDQQILSLYYVENCSFHEIGEILGLTEARICQIHASAILHLRMRLQGEEE